MLLIDEYKKIDILINCEGIIKSIIKDEWEKPKHIVFESNNIKTGVFCLAKLQGDI